jgi:hypothetical protein
MIRGTASASAVVQKISWFPVVSGTDVSGLWETWEPKPGNLRNLFSNNTKKILRVPFVSFLRLITGIDIY